MLLSSAVSDYDAFIIMSKYFIVIGEGKTTKQTEWRCPFFYSHARHRHFLSLTSHERINRALVAGVTVTCRRGARFAFGRDYERLFDTRQPRLAWREILICMMDARQASRRCAADDGDKFEAIYTAISSDATLLCRPKPARYVNHFILRHQGRST